MPELPEVEGFRALIEREVVGRRIERARFLDDWMLKCITPATAARRLRGRRVTAVDRKGKMLALFTDGQGGRHDMPVLALHFGMTGRPLIEPGGSRPHRWDRAVLELDSKRQFRYRNSRRLGSLRVVTRAELADLVWQYGPDPLEAPASYLEHALEGRTASIKALLLDQSFLAGVGNIYADEALLEAGVRPTRPGGRLRPEEIDRLHRALRRILARAVKAHRAGRDAGFPLLDLREQASRNLALSGVPAVGCPRCGRRLRSARVGGRTSFYCTSCQR